MYSEVDSTNQESVMAKKRKKKVSSAGKNKVHVVMSEFKRGKLHSSSGDKVKNRKQAIAIALSESRRYGHAKKSKRKRGLKR